MSRQFGSLHRSISHPANLQNTIFIIPLFAFLPLDSPHINTSSGMNSDANSDITVFHTISQYENSVLETPEEFADSEPSPSTFSQTSPSTFSQPPFRPIHSQARSESPTTLSHRSQLTPTYSLFTIQRSINNSPDNTQISNELNNLITLQQQVQHPQTLTIDQLSSNPPTPTPSSDYTLSFAQLSTSTQSSSRTSHAYKTFKRKFPNHPFPSKPGTTRDY